MLSLAHKKCCSCWRTDILALFDQCIVVWWKSVSHTPRRPQVQALNKCADFCRAGILLVWVHWSSTLSLWFPLGTKALTVYGWTMLRTTRRLALTQSSRGDVGHTCSRPFITIIFGPSPNCWELAGVRRGEAGGFGPRGFIERRDGGRKRGTRQGQGDGRSLGIEQLPISQLNTGITEEAETENMHRCGSLFPPDFPYLPIFFSSVLLSLFLISILPRTPSFSDSFCKSLFHCFSFTAFDAPRCVFYPFYQLASLFLLRVGKDQASARDWDQHHLL